MLHTPPRASRHAGFSLVELSIVLVILGLLVGGVLSGQSLIRAAELRSVNTEYSKYYSAVMTFRDKYMALPGDMPSATKFWGLSNAAGCVSNSGVTPASASGTCDGDGDGQIRQGAAASETAENTQFWRQLALAKLIEGDYTGVSGPMSGSNIECTVGTGCPASKLANAGWGVYYLGNYAGDVHTYAYDWQTFMTFGKKTPNYVPSHQILTAEEAWSIDKKMDDGMPGTGRIMANYWDTCTEAQSETQLSKGYKLAAPGITCSLRFPSALF